MRFFRFALLAVVIALLCVLLAACAPAPLSAVEAEVRLTQIARGGTATAEAVTRSATERAQAAQADLQAAQAERVRLENARLEAEVELAQARATEQARERQAVAAREQADWERRREAEEVALGILGLCLGAVALAGVAIVCVQAYHFLDRLRQWAERRAEAQALVAIWRARAEAAQHLRLATEAAQRQAPDGRREAWDFETGEWRALALAPPPSPGTEPPHIRDWRVACKRLVGAAVARAQAGEPHPFSERALCGLEAVVVRPGTAQPYVRGYRRLMEVLTGAGVLASQEGGRTTWAAGWDWERFGREFDLVPLPHCPEGAPPEVKIPVAVARLSQSVAVSQS